MKIVRRLVYIKRIHNGHGIQIVSKAHGHEKTSAASSTESVQ